MKVSDLKSKIEVMQMELDEIVENLKIESADILTNLYSFFIDSGIDKDDLIENKDDFINFPMILSNDSKISISLNYRGDAINDYFNTKFVFKQNKINKDKTYYNMIKILFLFNIEFIANNEKIKLTLDEKTKVPPEGQWDWAFPGFLFAVNIIDDKGALLTNIELPHINTIE